MPDTTTSEHAGFEALVELLSGRPVVVLGGAGCSTESGIPDYRGPEGKLRTRNPVQYGEFVRSVEARSRYWARSTVGWPRMSSAEPNDAHLALARLEMAGVVCGVITQNVDGLHQAAGSRDVVELHGSLAVVRCLGCGASVSRDAMQDRLLEANADWADTVGAVRGERAELAPDGDAELATSRVSSFVVPPCRSCGGILKPDVVFFGENVPKETLARSWALFGRGAVLLVVGSSLTVYSGRRFVYRAAENGVPIGVVNLGPTRADEHAHSKVEGRLGEVLPHVADALVGTSPG